MPQQYGKQRPERTLPTQPSPGAQSSDEVQASSTPRTPAGTQARSTALPPAGCSWQAKALGAASCGVGRGKLPSTRGSRPPPSRPASRLSLPASVPAAPGPASVSSPPVPRVGGGGKLAQARLSSGTQLPSPQITFSKGRAGDAAE